MKKKEAANEDEFEIGKFTNRFEQKKFTKVFMDTYNRFFSDYMYTKFKKKDITNWLENPSQLNDKRLIDSSNYFYRVSNHYRRLVNYPSLIASFDYILGNSETNIDSNWHSNMEDVLKAYMLANNIVKSMNIKQEFQKIMKICFREDVFYGYVYKTENNGSFYIKQLPTRYCRLSSVTDGCLTYEFDFSYFDMKSVSIESYGDEFIDKYKLYKNKNCSRWQEIELDNGGICIKFEDTLPYVLPPFIGIVPDLFDLQMYKTLKKVNENLGNFNILSMSSPLNKEGKPTMSFEKLKEYYNFMASELPEGVGLAIAPTKMEHYKFDKSGSLNSDSVKEATDSVYSSAGISPLLFSSDKSGSAIITSSIEIDSTYVYAMYRQFERWVNYQLKILLPNNTLKLTILDTTTLNREKKLQEYKELGTYGIPVIQHLTSLSGMDFSDVNFSLNLQNAFGLHERMKPLVSSHVQSENDESGGREELPDDQISEEGDKSRSRDEYRWKFWRTYGK